MANNEYKSIHSGEDIDNAVSIVLGQTTPPVNSPLVFKSDILNETGPNTNKIMSQAATTAMCQADGNFMQIGFEYNQSIPDTNEKNVLYGYGSTTISSGTAFSINGTNRTVVIGAGITAIKVTMVYVIIQYSTSTRLTVGVKKNGNNFTGSYVWQDLDGVAGTIHTIVNPVLIPVSQNDELTFYVRSNGNTGTNKDGFRSLSHILLEVVK